MMIFLLHILIHFQTYDDFVTTCINTFSKLWYDFVTPYIKTFQNLWYDFFQVYRLFKVFGIIFHIMIDMIYIWVKLVLKIDTNMCYEIKPHRWFYFGATQNSESTV